MAKMEPYEEVKLARENLTNLVSCTYGTDWSVAYQVEPEDTLAVGVQADDGVLVMGDSVSQEGIAEDDGKFIATMDPGTALLLIDVLDMAVVNIRQGNWSLGLQRRILRIARRINEKNPRGES